MLTIQDISKSFENSPEPTLKSINLYLNPGDFCVVIGSNGSGKSTLLKTIAGEYRLDAGQIIINGENLTQKKRSHVIAAVTQDVNQGTIPQMTLLENMALSLSRTRKLNFLFYQKLKRIIVKEIQDVGVSLERYLHSPLCHLSGGQRQMIATIMAIASNPKLLLLDEHTSALDPHMQKLVMAYTNQAVAKKGLTSLMVTHNLADAIQFGNRLIMLHQGKIVLDVSGTEKSQLKATELLHLFQHYEANALLETSR